MKENKIELTEKQALGVKMIKEFLTTPVIDGDINSKVFVIQGQAGTGKTTMLREALADIISAETHLNFESVKNVYEADLFTNGPLGCVGVTVAHKAKKVLNMSIPICCTYASYFGLVMSIDDYGNKIFRESPNIKTKNNALFRKTHNVAVHDEISMHDLNMINHNLSNTPFDTKIILVGDPGQLPPILENDENPSDDDSPAFHLFQNKIILDQKVRQTIGNPIIELTDFIYSKIFKPDLSITDLNEVLGVMASPKFNEGIGYAMVKFTEFLPIYTSLTKDFLDSKVVAYRNDTVKMYNQIIRDYVNHNPIEKIIPGELIYMNDTFVLNTKTMFYNSDEYIITSTTLLTHEGVECYQSFVDRDKHPHLNTSQNTYMLIPTEDGEKELRRLTVYFDREIAAQPYGSQQRKIAQSLKYKFLDKFAKISYGYCYTSHKS